MPAALISRWSMSASRRTDAGHDPERRHTCRQVSDPASVELDDRQHLLRHHKFVLDANDDGYFDADQNDLVNSPTGYDFLVYDDPNVVLDGAIGEIGDNGRTRDFFSAGKADGIYTLSEHVTRPSWNTGTSMSTSFPTSCCAPPIPSSRPERSARPGWDRS